MPRGRHRTGYAYRKARAYMFATYGDTCHLCGHGGATDADHLIPISVDDEQPIDPHMMRPAHGVRGCVVCGARCNQVRGNRPNRQAYRPTIQW